MKFTVFPTALLKDESALPEDTKLAPTARGAQRSGDGASDEGGDSAGKIEYSNSGWKS